MLCDLRTIPIDEKESLALSNNFSREERNFMKKKIREKFLQFFFQEN